MDKVLSQEIIFELENLLQDSNLSCDVLFENLLKKYKAIDVALICNYILQNKNNAKLLGCVIRFIDKNKYIQNFDTLLDFIVQINAIDLKVLAIKTIAKYKNTKAVPVLLNCLKDKKSNYKVRFAAADALGKIGDKNAFDSLTLIACDTDEKSAYVKESAITALGNLGDDRAIDVFSSIMSSKEVFLDKFSYLKERIIEAISKLDISKNKKAIDILKTSLLDLSPTVRINTIEALMNLDNLCGWDLIYDRLLYDDNFEVKKNALIALYNLSDRKILDEVILGDFPDELKKEAQAIINEYEVDDA